MRDLERGPAKLEQNDDGHVVYKLHPVGHRVALVARYEDERETKHDGERSWNETNRTLSFKLKRDCY